MVLKSFLGIAGTQRKRHIIWFIMHIAESTQKQKSYIKHWQNNWENFLASNLRKIDILGNIDKVKYNRNIPHVYIFIY